MLSFLDDDDEDILSTYGVTATPKPSSNGNPSSFAGTPTTTGTGESQTPRRSPPRKAGIKTPAVFSPKVLFTPPPTGSNTSQSESRNYGSRMKSGDVVLRYNCKDSQLLETENLRSIEWEVSCTGIWKIGTDLKYMFQRTREMALTLNYTISSLGESMIDYYSLDPPQSLKNSTAADEVYLGRVRNDGKLTAGSVYLEGSLGESQGHIVSLDFSALEEYFVFPGQVLGVAGKNNLGRCVSVSKTFIPRPLPFSDKSLAVNKATGPMRILIAAGPFTPTDSLLYEPLKDLISVITKTQPDICILLGPFLDASHPLVEAGDVILEDTFEDMFNKQMTDLSNSLENIHTQVVVVSSFKEAHHHPVYPTPAYSTKFRNILAVPDPATISVGGISIGITSVDILMHLSRNELAHASISNDRMGRITRHLLSQRNFYPLYPPDETVPLDIEKWSDFGQMDYTPHILVVPSDLRHFIKDVDGTVVINPERLTKGHSGGTYARIQIDLPTESEDGIGNGSPIADFVTGEILKI